MGVGTSGTISFTSAGGTLDRVVVIGLGVEAENANALGLYRSVGLEIAREVRALLAVSTPVTWSGSLLGTPSGT